MKKINISKANFNQDSLYKFWIFIGFFLAASCVIVGCFLVGFYFKNFLTYYNLAQAWNGGPGFSDYVASHNSYFDTYSDSDYSTWVYASYTLFAVGLGFLLIGFILFCFFIWVHIKHKKKLKTKPNANKINSNVGGELEPKQKETIVKEKKTNWFNKNKKYKTI